MKILNFIWYYFSYPIRLLLKEKVSLYKYLLEELKLNSQSVIIKSRRIGYSKTNMEISMYRQYVILKLQRFVNRWEIIKH